MTIPGHREPAPEDAVPAFCPDVPLPSGARPAFDDLNPVGTGPDRVSVEGAPARSSVHRLLTGRMLLTFLLVVSASVVAVLAQISSPRGRNLMVPEYFENAGQPGARTNLLKGRLTLQEVEYLPNRLIHGRTMQLEQYGPDGRTNVIARAPECYFNDTNRTASSTGRLEIIAMDGRVLITGQQGFEVSLTNTALLVSNRVRTVLKLNILKP